MRNLLFGFIVIVTILVAPAAAGAQEFNHTITVYATVPEQRAIYLDQYGGVISIAGNTTRNIQPRVFDASNHEVPMAPAIQQVYDDFLKQHGGKLQASKVYEVNPLKVDNSSNSASISLSTLSQAISLSIK